MRIIFKDARVFNTKYQNYFKRTNVLIENGKIEAVGDNLKEDNIDRTIECNGNILMPSFVNCHAHTPMTLLRSICDDKPLQEWLFDNVLKAEALLTDEDIYWGQMLGICEYVKAGITTFDESYFKIKNIVKACEKAGVRARIAIGDSLPGANIDVKKQMQEDINLFKNYDMIKPVCYIHSIYASSEKAINDVVEFSVKNNIDRSVHLSETLKEVGDCTVANNGKTPPKYLEDFGFFDKKTLCFHCVHCDKDDLDILCDYDVTICTCPSSNIKLASGIAPLFAAQNKKINIAIGTDGAASNNSLDMFKEMFLASTLSKVDIRDSSVVSAIDVLEMATKNGAKALGFNSGEIQEGKNADLILIDINSPHLVPHHNLQNSLVYAAKSSDVYLTMCNGKILYENGQFYVGEDYSKIVKKANEIRERITNGN